MDENGCSKNVSQDGGKLSLGAINRVERNWNRGWRFRTEGDAKAAAEYEVPFALGDTMLEIS